MVNIIVGVAIGFLYLYLMDKFFDKSMVFLEKKGIKDHWLKVLPFLLIIIFTSYLFGFVLPNPIHQFTGIFRIFTYFGGTALIVALFLLIIVRPISPKLYEKLSKNKN
jgi:nitrate reductase gamma subunit